MRKTSQDGGDSSSITSGIENDIKKPGAILKTKRNSIKRKVQSLSHESDDTVIEPLLQKDKEKSEISNQSAKYNLLSKTKTDFKGEKENDKEKLLQNEKTQNSDARNVDDTIISMPSSNMLPKSSGVTAPLHNHMNTNVFHSHDGFKGLVTPKTQMLVEIDGCKQSGYNPSPLIFTSAKIHTDGKTKHMEPLQVTSVPILSTIEVSVLKGTGSAGGESTGAVTSNISTIYTNVSKNNTNTLDKDLKLKSIQTSPAITSVSGTGNAIIADNKALSSTDMTSLSHGVSTKNSKDQKTESTATIPNNTKGSQYINSEDKKEKDIKQTKMSLSQPVRGSSSEKPKTTISNDFKKPVIKSVDTKDGVASYSDKNTTSDKLDRTTKTEKFPTKKTDFNKNVKAIDSRESSHTSTLDIKSDATSRGNILAKTSSIKQLQRQKVAIDKDDPISKLKLSTDSSTLDEPATLKKHDDIVTSITTPVTNTKSPVNDVNRISDKSKLPNSTANYVQITNSISNYSNNSHITTTVVNMVNKSTTSNSFAAGKPTVTAHSTTEGVIPVSSQQPGAKPLSSNMVTTASSNKLTNNISSSKPSASTVSSTSASSAVTSVKTVNVSTVGTLPITSQSISNAKLPVKQSSPVTTIAANVTKATPETIVSTSMESATKNTAAPSSTTKVSSVPISISKTIASISATKTTSITTDGTKSSSGSANALKTSSILTSSVKTPSVSSTTAKTSSISTNVAKTTSVPTCAGKTPTVSTSTAKTHAVSTSIGKTATVPTSVAKSTSVPTSTAKTGSVSTSIAKTPTSASAIKTSNTVTSSVKAPVSTTTPATTAKSSSVATSNAKSSTSKSTIPINKVSVSSPATSSAKTTTSKDVDLTTKSVESNKKSEKLSNGNKSSKA